ncbi:Ankyrin repeats (many copies) (plasmid) [Caballeronia sp. SBC1]|uniref:ankyrin repeat domain-containing protein n=1 Tax=unclassified Caballeronia TaxID=2646786 RepID=UPI0013E1E005|nr:MULTISPECIES: ankyrin repeat domain-containing protein [unclassified Caballeronia]QIE25975.1 Ankyrin repeats (many copies) [Caballeronia sp. SBC2]QIN64712.1 Ankyrin repeats (many copies) [Caballeronia sp. SBC1]
MASDHFCGQDARSAPHHLSILIALALALTFTLTGCKMVDKYAWRYFSGQYLTAAAAIDRGDIAELRAAVGGLEIDKPGRDHMTLMWYAIMKNQYPAVTVLTRLGSNPDKQDVDGMGTPLTVALKRTDPTLLAALLDGGLSPDYQNRDGTSLMQQAVGSGEEPFPVVRLLVDRGADVNHRDSIHATALGDSIVSNHPDIAIYLIQHGADVTAFTMNGASVAYGVQVSIDDLQANAKQAIVSNYTLDNDGKPVVTETTPPPQGAAPEGQALLRKYEELRALMMEKGAKFPPDSPAQVREQMKIK